MEGGLGQPATNQEDPDWDHSGQAGMIQDNPRTTWADLR